MGTREPDVAPPGNGRPEGGPQPSLGPTNPATLVVAALVTAALAWMFISRGNLPPDINWLPGITLAALSMLANFAFIPYYPLWSLSIIALNVFVIWALCVYNRDTAARL